MFIYRSVPGHFHGYGFTHFDQVMNEVMCYANKMRCTVQGGIFAARCFSAKLGFGRGFSVTCRKRQIDRRCSFFAGIHFVIAVDQ